ncbi:hypothetical protein BKA63DRAFT_492500 [Paraphoma chrysanthemicola]|nr:hypothetical protein BKA63DRAFT_492500 [Paraphoma chrysanthemicola]
MSLSHIQTNILVASLSGSIIVVVFITLVLLRGRVPFTFSRSNPPSTHPTPTPPAKKPPHRGWLAWLQNNPVTSSTLTSAEKDSTDDTSEDTDDGEVEGAYEKYGELYVPPNKQPTVIALDIIMRCLLATGLPGRTTFGSVTKPETAVVRDGGFEGASVMENGHAAGPPKVSLDLERPVSFSPEEYVEITLSPIRPAKMERKDEIADSVLEQSREDELVVDPIAGGFGRGEGMARMYR